MPREHRLSVSPGLSSGGGGAGGGGGIAFELRRGLRSLRARAGAAASDALTPLMMLSSDCDAWPVWLAGIASSSPRALIDCTGTRYTLETFLADEKKRKALAALRVQLQRSSAPGVADAVVRLHTPGVADGLEIESDVADGTTRKKKKKKKRKKVERTSSRSSGRLQAKNTT